MKAHPWDRRMMTSTIGNKPRGFTLIELAVVVAIIFFLAGSLVVMIPRIELRAAIKRAEGDIARLEQALALHKEIMGWYPPDSLAHFSGYDLAQGNVNSNLRSPNSPIPWLTRTVGAVDARTYPQNASGFTAEEMSNILLVHFLTAGRESTVFLQFAAKELTAVGYWNSHSTDTDAKRRRQVDPAYSYLSQSDAFEALPPDPLEYRRAYMFLDPWGNPYVYDNNVGLPANTLFVDPPYDEAGPCGTATFRRGHCKGAGGTQPDPNQWFDGAPNNNPNFDLYSYGPNGVTALTSDGSGNGIDDSDGSSTTEPTGTNYHQDVWDDAFYNGRERTTDVELGDDLNNYRRGR